MALSDTDTSSKFIWRRLRLYTLGLFVWHQSPFLHFKHLQSFLFGSLQIGLHVVYHLHLRMEALFSMDEHKAETRNVAVRSRSLHTAHKTQDVLNDVSQEHIVSGADLIRTLRVLYRGLACVMLTISRKAQPVPSRYRSSNSLKAASKTKCYLVTSTFSTS